MSFSKLRFGALSIWVALGTSLISLAATLLLFWAASRIETPFSPTSPHADVVLLWNTVIRYCEAFGHLVGFCMGLFAVFRPGDSRWLGAIGVVLNVLLSFAGVLIHPSA